MFAGFHSLLKLPRVHLQVGEVDLFSLLHSNIFVAFEVFAERSQCVPLCGVHVHVVAVVDELNVQLVGLLADIWVAVAEHLHEASLKLFGKLIDGLFGVCGELAHAALMRMGVHVTCPAVLVLALLSTQLTEVLELLLASQFLTFYHQYYFK